MSFEKIKSKKKKSQKPELIAQTGKTKFDEHLKKTFHLMSSKKGQVLQMKGPNGS